MKNLLEEYLERHNIRMSDFARMLRCNPASVYHWKIKKISPRAETAWLMHKLTNGEVPITYWGYVIINGKIKKIDKCSIEIPTRRINLGKGKNKRKYEDG